MTELSLLWNGTVTGDATLAPYDKTLFNTYMAGLHVDSLTQAYVIPGYLNDLEVVENGSLGFSVLSGAAIFGEYVYINDNTLNFSLEPAATGYFRYDVLVVEKNASTQKVRLKVIKGSDTTSYLTLTDPILTADQSIIARFYIDSNYATLGETYIYDQRHFAYNNYAVARYGGFLGNLIRNSEFMGFSSSDGSMPPDMWEPYGDSSPAASTFERFGYVTMLLLRSTWIRMDGIDNSGFSQDFEYNDIRFNDPVTLTVKGKLAILNGTQDITITVALLTQANEIIRSQTFEKGPVVTPIEYEFTVNYTGENQFKIAVYGTGQYQAVGPIIVVPGYHPGPFRFFNEMIPFNEPVTDASWSSTAKSSSTTTISLNTDFGAVIWPYTKAVLLKLRANDSGSAAVAPFISAIGYASPYSNNYCTVDLSGVNNDSPREAFGIVPVNQNLSNAKLTYGQFRITLTASGALALDATAEIVGIVV